MSPLPAMLFAAGFGTRMGALTENRPKPLIEVAGRALIDHALDIAAGAGSDPVVVNAHYRADQLADHLRGRNVRLSRETPEILDTGGGLKAALPLLGGGACHTLNTDAVWAGPNPLTLLGEAWVGGPDALLLVVPASRTHGRSGPGDFSMNEDGTLRRGGDLVYTGAEIIDTGALHAVPERVFSLGRVWDALAGEGRLRGLVYPGHWADVGHPGGIAEAEGMLADV